MIVGDARADDNVFQAAVSHHSLHFSFAETLFQFRAEPVQGIIPDNKK
jgi:hypothetical protein